MSSVRSTYYNQVIAGSEGIWFYEEDPSNYMDDESEDEYNVFDDDDYLQSYNDIYDESDESDDENIE